MEATFNNARYSTFNNDDCDRFDDILAFEAAAEFDAHDTKRISLDLINKCEPTVNADGDVLLRGESGREIKLNAHSFRQYLSTALEAGTFAKLSKRLTPETIRRALTELRDDLIRQDMTHDGAILYRKSTGTARAVVGPKFAPVFDAVLLRAVQSKATAAGMVLAPGAPGSGGKLNTDGPRALWRNEERSAAFFVHDAPLPGTGPWGGLTLALGTVNSEVGCSSVRLDSAIYRFQCANLMIWGTERTESHRVAQATPRRRRDGVGERNPRRHAVGRSDRRDR